MGFFDKLGSTIKTAAKRGVMDSVTTSIYSNLNNKSSLSRTISGTVLNDDEIFNSIYGADSDLFIGANTTKQRVVPEISASQKTARNSKLKESTMK